MSTTLPKGKPTPKDPTVRNPYRKAMKGKFSRSGLLALSRAKWRDETIAILRQVKKDAQ